MFSNKNINQIISNFLFFSILITLLFFSNLSSAETFSPPEFSKIKNTVCKNYKATLAGNGPTSSCRQSSFEIVSIDLNSDEKPELLYFRDDSGAHAISTFYIFQKTGSVWKFIGQNKGSQVWLNGTKHLGFEDLLTSGSGGACYDGFSNVTWNGTTYTTSSTYECDYCNADDTQKNVSQLPKKCRYNLDNPKRNKIYGSGTYAEIVYPTCKTLIDERFAVSPQATSSFKEVENVAKPSYKDWGSYICNGEKVGVIYYQFSKKDEAKKAADFLKKNIWADKKPGPDHPERVYGFLGKYTSSPYIVTVVSSKTINKIDEKIIEDYVWEYLVFDIDVRLHRFWYRFFPPERSKF